MILVRTDWPDFATYLKSLSKPARKNYKAVMKDYANMSYAHWSGVGFPTEDVRKFMRLWEQQLVLGKHPEWAFQVEHIEHLSKTGVIRLFKVIDNATGEDVGMQFIQQRGGYIECHPPMYNKTKHPSLAKFMWFKLIEHAISFELDHLDLGGMGDDWHFNLRNWREYKHQYKWHFIPQRAKDDPDSEPKYYIGRPQCSLLKN